MGFTIDIDAAGTFTDGLFTDGMEIKRVKVDTPLTSRHAKFVLTGKDLSIGKINHVSSM